MELSELRKIVRLMLRADLSELEIDDSNRGMRVHLKRGTGSGEVGSHPVVQVMQPIAGPPGAGLIPDPTAPTTAERIEEGEIPPGTEVMESPMVGTFYRSPSPEAESFVETGSKFSEESVLCIIEAMKVMNEIRAEMKGEIVEILVENGEPVEFGQPLFLLKKG